LQQTYVEQMSDLLVEHRYFEFQNEIQFLARDSIYAIARSLPTPVRLSVCPSVCHTGGSVKDGSR